jgi:hypothetical protein
MIDGGQYLAISTGLGGCSPRNLPNAIVADVQYPRTGDAMYVFALPERK